MNRAAAARVRDAISSYNHKTTYQVECFDALSDKLIVTVPGGLLAEQRELIKRYRDELVALLTTPPEQSGTCVRGHAIVWRCNDYGLWVCACYFVTSEATTPPEQSTPASTTRNYWKAKEDSIGVLPSPFTQKATVKKVQSDSQAKYNIEEKALW
jgi:hypothetical protein